MKIGSKIALVVGVIFLILCITTLSAVVSTYNTLVTQEKLITAQYEQDKNNYDNFFKKVREVAQVPEMYTADMKKIWDGVMANRYGKDGSKAMFNWIQEHNPTVDSALYRQIQQTIEAGRNDFEQNQLSLIDKKRAYETMLATFPNNIIAGIFGFPKIDLKNLGIITSDITEEAFKTKKTDPIKLR